MGRAFQKAGIVGVGTMGAGIAEVLAKAGLDVIAVEIDDVGVKRGREHLEHSTERAVRRGKLAEAERDELLGRISLGTSLEALADADIVLVVLDITHLTESDAEADWDLLARTKDRRRILVCSKSDLHTEDRGIYTRDLPAEVQTEAGVFTSAVTGEGIEDLRSQILSAVGGDGGAQHESGFLTNVRQHQLVHDSLTALDLAAAAVPLKIPHEMLLLDLYNALRPLDEITGITTADDVLNLIFSSFCIGK
jgi:tRNA modification GTPase